MSGPAGPRYVVTGASGWVGQGVLHALRRRHGADWATRVSVFGSTERLLAAPDGAMLPQRALETLGPGDVAGAQVIHLAFLGRERCAPAGEAAFCEANRRIDATLAAAVKAAGTPPAGLFVASSGAARAAEQGLDLHAYGMAKLEQEAAFRDLSDRTGTPLYVGRIYTLAGPYINKLDGYALSSFLLQALHTKRIRIDAAQPVFRSYLHVLDLAALVCGALARGGGWGGPRDLCGMEAVEMADVARAAAKATGLPRSAILRDALELARPSAYLGDPIPARTLALAQSSVLKPFAAQVADTAKWLMRRKA